MKEISGLFDSIDQRLSRIEKFLIYELQEREKPKLPDDNKHPSCWEDLFLLIKKKGDK